MEPVSLSTRSNGCISLSKHAIHKSEKRRSALDSVSWNNNIISFPKLLDMDVVVDMEDRGNWIRCVLYVCVVSDGAYLIIYMAQLSRYSNILGVLFFCLKHIVEAGKVFYRYQMVM